LGDPGDGPAAGVYALVFLDAGRAQDAERYAGMALRHNPDSIDGLTVCATLRLWHADGDAAERVFQGIIARAPATGRAWIGLGATALLRQDLTEAVRCLTRGVELMPAHAGSRQILGWTYLVRGDLDAAERVFREGIELDRNFGEAHGALASLFALRGQRSESEEEIRIADRLDRAGFAKRSWLERPPTRARRAPWCIERCGVYYPA
jgi:Tfp pilus assembly protein PilF